MPAKPFLAALAVVVLAACSAPIGGPGTAAPGDSFATEATPPMSSTPSVAPTTAPPSIAPTASSFASPLYGYSLVLPPGWQATPAVVKWDGRVQPAYDDSDADRFVGPANAITWAFAGSTSLDLAGFVKDRIAANARDHGDTCPAKPDVNEPIQIGGEPGTFLAWNCGLLINQAVVVHKGLAFSMVMRDFYVHAATDAADRELLVQLLDGVAFPG